VDLCGLVFVLLEMGFLVSIAASLLRMQRPAGDVHAIGDLRTVISAEAQYSQGNGGFFDTLECLTAPSPCIPGETATPGGVTYLDPAFLRRERHGYVFTFHPGPVASSRDPVATSPSSLAAFAYVGAPRTSGSGLRAFCGEASGRICFTSSEPMPAVRDGVCPPAPACADLQ
jgi:hypothetical protein